ncbi:PKD domain-containing protein [Desulfobacterota bacterium M19]
MAIILSYLSLSFFFAAPALAVLTAPTVRVMPNGIETSTQHTSYAWAGNPVDVWGNVTWGSSDSGTYVWNFGDGSSTEPALITNTRNISELHAYATAGTYYATLTVTDGNGTSSSAQVRIDIQASATPQVRINRAIEAGLKRLYLDQGSGGDWGGEPANGALSVLAFENHGHQPIGSTTDIYHNTVVNGLNWLFTSLRVKSSSQSDSPNWKPVESNGDGVMLGQFNPYCGDESFYPHGMIMMALVASGAYDKNYPVTDTLHNPALNLKVPASVPTIGGWTYYKVLQDMMEFAAWAQADPGTSGRGGWRYCPNNGDADNSVGQWPVIGLEAAEQWGIMAPAWVKSELKNYWLANSYNSHWKGWGYNNSSYIDVAHAGAGLSMMAYVGIPKTNSWYVEALDGLAAHWKANPVYTWDGLSWAWWPSHFGNTEYGQVENYYAMYGVAKAMRIARDSNGKISEITQIGTHSWYDEYSAFLVGIQNDNGSWPGYFYFPQPISTAFSLLILEPTVSSLRPVASITASPNPVNSGTTVNFNISGSTHQDPTKFLVSWKIIFDASSGKTWNTPDLSGNFPISGTIAKVGGYPPRIPSANYDVTAKLQVTDNEGDTAENSVVVHIVTGLVNPVANPGGPYFGGVNAPITLNGCASSDSNSGGNIVKYEWDLDGNGTYETDAGDSCTLQHTWISPYNGQIGLRVTDNNNLVATAAATTNIVVADLKAITYPLVSYKRITRTIWEYTYQFVIRNQGNGKATNISAQLQNWPAQVTVVDGKVSFPNIAAGSQDTSTDTFIIRIDRTTPVQNRDLTWKISYTDAGGNSYTIMNFPLF